MFGRVLRSTPKFSLRSGGLVRPHPITSFSCNFADAPKPVAESTQKIDEISIADILKDLDLQAHAANIQNPPSLPSLPGHTGPLTVADLIKLTNEEMRLVLPAVLPRNKLKEHLRLLTGGHIAADGDQAPLDASAPAAVTEVAAAKEVTNALIKTLTLPELLPGVTEATITKWHVKPGQHFNRGQPLCDIDVDVAEIEYEADEPGHISEVLVPEGGKVKAGEAIAVQTYHE